MEKDEIATILNGIGQILMKETDFSLMGSLLFARVEAGAISLSLFFEDNKEIKYVQPKYKKYQALIFELWEGMEPEHEWRELHFAMRDKQFKATFVYADEFDDEDSWGDRRDMAIQRHLGDKPVIYSPWDDTDFTEL